ncbi:MAG TPA: helix-turn-helix domain-containing protein [Gaiellaceae bacterium]|nr:helix-turn-helix domain-containing protein [Gaiellaceae bacterium]
MPETLLLERDQAAWRLGVSVATLDRVRARGEIGCVRVGGRLVRFRPEHLEEYLARRAVEPQLDAPPREEARALAPVRRPRAHRTSVPSVVERGRERRRG